MPEEYTEEQIEDMVRESVLEMEATYEWEEDMKRSLTRDRSYGIDGE